MNDKKISIISIVKDEDSFLEFQRYLNRLIVPDGFEIELLPVSGAANIAAGYNYAMSLSDAKYKVYLSQDDYLVQPDCLQTLISLFEENPDLGAIGTIGAKDFPLSCKLSEAKYKFGGGYTNSSGTMQKEWHLDPQTSFETVTIAEGLFITQVDCEWEENTFLSQGYTLASQCVRLINKGYEIGVPHQTKPWILSDRKIEAEGGFLELDRKQFIELYSAQLFPKVSILIPTYNRPDFFEQALRSVLEQTYKHIEIVICDDSTNDRTYHLIQPYLIQYSHIRYYKNEKNLGQFENDLKLMELAEGEYINFLMDDDLFHPEKIEKMMKYFLLDYSDEISIVTSRRIVIDEYGDQRLDIPLSNTLFQTDTLVDGIEMGNYIVTYNQNRIGEPTTALFKKEKLKVPFGTFCGRRYGCNVDVATWLNLLAGGKIVYIAEALSYFRLHSGQQLSTVKMKLMGTVDYAHTVLNARYFSFLSNSEDYEDAIKICLQYLTMISNTFTKQQGEESLELVRWSTKLKEALAETSLMVEDEQPLVSILIPTYNRPELLKRALISALNQTYAHIEIVIADDSTNNLTEVMIQPYLRKHDNIRYYKNETNLNEYNFHRCFDLAKGEYINFLMDDDLFHEEKIKKMVKYLKKNKTITLVTSVRELIDEFDNPLPPIKETIKLFDKDTIIPGKIMSNTVLENMRNIIGEPTTVMFRKSDIDSFGSFCGKNYSVLNDLATWISLMNKGNVAYIAEPLSYFRKHSGQNQTNLKFYYKNALDWFNIITDSKEIGLLNNEKVYKTCITQYINFVTNRLIPLYIEHKSEQILIDNNISSLISSAYDILLSYKDNYTCPYCEERFASFVPWSDIYDFPQHTFEMFNKSTAICPHCEAIDRERLYRIYFERETEALSGLYSILHIAPERNLRQFIAKHIPNEKYICGDLYPTDPSILKMDATQLPFESNSFDVVICSHVLEHIPDDKAAMKEFYRVLRPGGWGIMQVPIAVDLLETYEDWTIKTPEERKVAFGQIDHVRIYGQDYVDRLQKVGFKVEKFNLAKKYGLSEAHQYGLSENDNVYIIRK